MWKIVNSKTPQHREGLLRLLRVICALSDSHVNSYHLLRYEANTSWLLLNQTSVNAAIAYAPESEVLRHPLYKNSLLVDFNEKNALRLTNTVPFRSVDPQPVTTKSSRLTRDGVWQFFQTYLRFNISTGSSIFKTHPSFFYFFIRSAAGGPSIISIPKFFTRWKDINHLLMNLAFHRIESLVFGTNFFQEEVLAANWRSVRRWKFMWKFIRPFLFVQSNKITNHGDRVFSHLNDTGLRIGLIMDLPYHMKTVYYLHRAGFYTIAPVPINYDIALVDFAVPSSVNSVFSQLFFTRFFLQTQRSARRHEFSQLHSCWLFRHSLDTPYEYIIGDNHGIRCGTDYLTQS